MSATEPFDGTEPEPFVPDVDPTDFSSRHRERETTRLATAAREARQRPGAWVYAGSTKAPISEMRWRFIAEVTEGKKSTLGGLSEQWNATVTMGIVRNGKPLQLDRKMLRPGEVEVCLKSVCFLGPRPDGQ